MSHQRIVNQFAHWRAKARFIPKRFQQRSALPFSSELLRGAFILGGIVTVILIAYAHFGLGIKSLSGDFKYAVRYGILTFAFIFSLPILALAISWNRQHRAKAFEMMTSPRCFPEHVCLALLFVYGVLEGIRIALPYAMAIWNAATHQEFPFHSLTLSEFYQIWLLTMIISVTLYEVYLIFMPKWMERKYNRRPASPFGLWIGKSTGLLAKRSHGAGLHPDQHITLSLHDATHHVLILGGTGAGKTTRMINPMLLQLMEQDCGGLIFDIKGDFHKTVYHYAQGLMGDNHRIVQLGIGGQPINLIEGLTPEMAGSFLKSTLLLSDARTDGFWTDTATTLCTNVLGILSFLPDKYDLISVYDYLFNSRFKASVNDEVRAISLVLEANQLRALNSYQDYVDSTFESFEEKTKNGVKATAAQVLAPLVQAPALGDAFCQSSDLKMEKVLDGTIYLINLPLSEWGLGGKVIYNFIKMRFFNVMQKRRSQSAWNQNRPVFFMCDEYQQIATGDKDSLSDLNFWDTARSTYTIGIISAQSISSFYAAIGNTHVANAILQNFRQKVCFRSEDEETLTFFNRVTGNVEVEKKSTSKQRGTSSKSIGDSTNTHRSHSESITKVDKPVIDAQLIRNLNPDQAVAILVMQGHSCDDVLDTVTC